MTVSLLIEESKRIVSEFLHNCPVSSLRVIIQDEEGKFIPEEEMNMVICLADMDIGENSDIYVITHDDGIRNDDFMRKSSLIQISLENTFEETKEEYYEEGFFGSKTSLEVSEQFKQNFKSILSKPGIIRREPEIQRPKYMIQKECTFL